MGRLDSGLVFPSSSVMRNAPAETIMSKRNSIPKRKQAGIKTPKIDMKRLKSILDAGNFNIDFTQTL